MIPKMHAQNLPNSRTSTLSYSSVTSNNANYRTMDASLLEEIAHADLYEHLYALYTEHAPREKHHLGYVDKSQDYLEIFLALSGVDLKIRQSLAALSSGTQSSSTGFICWQVASLLADWAVASPQSPFKENLKNKVVLELGAGVSSVVASMLGPLCRHYVASDQRHVIRLLKENFVNNVTSQKYTSSTCERAEGGPKQSVDTWSKVDFIELDWEHPDQGVFEFVELTGTASPDFVFACDTIYNSYLIPYFLACLKAVMGGETVAVVAMQLRDEDVTEEFLEGAFGAGFRVFCVKHEVLSEELREGFVVYCLRV